MESKPRILYLLRILEQYTDEEHPLTTKQLIEMLNEKCGISTYRTTIAKDVAALQEFGVDIVVGQVKKLKRNNYVSGRIKLNNEQIYYIVDTINDAINERKQISFSYYEYTGLKEKVLRNKGEIYTISPYHLVWNDDYYYVVGYFEKREKIVTFRVDRIASQSNILSADAVPVPEDFDIAEFTKQVFYMYDGEEILVDLRCDNSLMKTMVDRFGEDITTLFYDENSFKITARVSESPTFFGWIFGFGGKVQILAPESVKEQYRQMIVQASKI